MKIYLVGTSVCSPEDNKKMQKLFRRFRREVVLYEFKK
jgi:hypothetical protein